MQREIDNYIGTAPAALLKNVEDFLVGAQIDRAELERFAFRPFGTDFFALYVSTVARGMAGSLSDIDLILVSPVVDHEGMPISQMLFHRGRRVGVKVIAAPVISAALETVQGIVSGDLGGVLSLPETSIQWEDLERVVNGISFTEGTPYLGHLAALSALASRVFFRELRERATFGALAHAAGQRAAAHAYIAASLTAAMDTMMACCGRIQANTKWTRERWGEFAGGVTDADAARGVKVIERLRAAVQCAGDLSSDQLIATAKATRDYFVEYCAGPTQSPSRLTIPVGVQKHPFLPGAVSLHGERSVAAVGSDLVARLDGLHETAFSTLDRDSLQAAVTLMQRGLLQVSIGL